MKRSREPQDDSDPDHSESATESKESYTGDSQPATKISQLNSVLVDDVAPPVMRCSLPPHKDPVAFKSYTDYEAHYNKFHCNRCLDCHKNFPTDHLLHIHIEECHDPLINVKRDRGEHTYSCFVEGCERKCLTHQKRRMHLIDKHMYPKNFFFAVTRDGIDGRRSLLIESGHRRRSSVASQTKDSRRRAGTSDNATTGGFNATRSPDVKEAPKRPSIDQEPNATHDEVDVITGAMSALQFVPQSVRFGRGRAGFSKS